MHTGNHIRYLTREEVDISRWDDCVIKAPNGWIYARSFFLDGLGTWGALVEGDYAHILPLPEKKKYGIRYIYIPPFTGQLGIIGAAPVSGELTDLFIRAIPASFRLVDIFLNEQNPVPSIPGITTLKRTNYTLSLKEEYAILYNRYTGDAKKNLRRTTGLGLAPCTDIPMAAIVEMYRAAYGKMNKRISDEEYSRLISLGDRCVKEGNGFSLGIQNPQGELLAAAFFGKDNKRVYYILGAPGLQGRRSNAVHSLIDEVIKKYAGTDIVFDFEGSDIPSVASFYRKFSPMTRHYDLVQRDRLPRWLQWYRRIRSGKAYPAP
jgi:hypothetical protein